MPVVDKPGGNAPRNAGMRLHLTATGLAGGGGALPDRLALLVDSVLRGLGQVMFQSVIHRFVFPVALVVPDAGGAKAVPQGFALAIKPFFA